MSFGGPSPPPAPPPPGVGVLPQTPPMFLPSLQPKPGAKGTGTASGTPTFLGSGLFATNQQRGGKTLLGL